MRNYKKIVAVNGLGNNDNKITLSTILKNIKNSLRKRTTITRCFEPTGTLSDLSRLLQIQPDEKMKVKPKKLLPQSARDEILIFLANRGMKVDFVIKLLVLNLIVGVIQILLLLLKSIL